jgi:hypothetical protein
MVLKMRSQTTVDATGSDHGTGGHREVVDDTQLLGKSQIFGICRAAY